MAYEKLKSESYQLLGGMNNKASPYNNSPMEFRELTNMQFTAPGAIDKRQGSTLFFQGSSTKILGLYEFERLNGSSYLLFNDNLGVYKTSLAGSTLLGGYTAIPIFGNSFITNTSGITTAGNISGKADITSFVDWSFFALSNNETTNETNTFNLRKSEGNTLFLFGLPRPPSFGLNYSGSSLAGAFGFVANAGTTFTGASLSTGLYKVAYSYINNRGYIGPSTVNKILTTSTTILTGKYIDNYIDNVANEYSLVLGGLASPPDFVYGSTAIQIDTPLALEKYPMYGISYIAIYCSLVNQSTPFYLTSIPLGTATFIIRNLSNLSEIAANDYGQITVSVSDNRPAYIDANLVYSPKWIEIYNNRLFIFNLVSTNNKFTPRFLISGGTTTDPSASVKTFTADEAKSSFVFSELGEPEAIDYSNLTQVRTNDGDEITGAKSYNNALVITKNRSIHQLNGTDPDNFVLNQITDQYGCVNNRAMVIFEDILWLLDRKGIIQYNGANVVIASTKMDSVFARMNYKYAQKEACAVYHKAINQVWFSFPVDESEENNMTVVFDIITKQWTKFEGFKPAVTTIAQSSLSKPQMFYGGYSGGIFHFSESYTVDYGQAGMTCLFQTPYYAPTGHTTERQFRRFYLDVDPVTGSSVPIQLNFLPNFGEAVGHTTQIYQNPFQSRVDFGIPAKSLSVQAKFFSATHSLKVNGYTFESRYQRNV